MGPKNNMISKREGWHCERFCASNFPGHVASEPKLLLLIITIYSTNTRYNKQVTIAQDRTLTGRKTTIIKKQDIRKITLYTHFKYNMVSDPSHVYLTIKIILKTLDDPLLEVMKLSCTVEKPF